MLPATSTRASTRLFGFPVHIRGGFVMFMILIVVVNGGSRGLWMAGGIAVFTLVHELGHAFAARAAGAEAEISLEFLAGYASYVPSRPLTNWSRAGIALAGPATQIVLSTAVLVGMGVNPLELGDVDRSNLTFAVWWSGPALGLMNLLPLMPLDGGNIAASVVESVAPDKGHRVMNIVSIPVTIGGLVFLATNDRLWGLLPFLVFLLIFQLQGLSSRNDADNDRRNADAEAAAWASGTADALLPDASPWLSAHVALREGRREDAARLLVDDLTTPNGTTGRWRAPDRATLRDLEALVGLLPRPLPVGNAYSELVLLGVLVRLGEYETAARYGADTHSRTPTTIGAVQVARSAAALGNGDLAVQWLRAAGHGTSHAMLVDVIDGAPELAGLRWRPDVQEIRAAAAQDASLG